MNMKKFIKVITLCSLVVLLNLSTTFAVSNNDSTIILTYDMSDKELVTLADKYGELKDKNVTISKLSKIEKTRALIGSEEININNSDVYVIQRILDDKESEVTVVADVAVPMRASGGTVESTKEGRVSIASVLKYETLNTGGLAYRKGTSFGGRVIGQQGGVSVQGLTGLYTDSGAYVTASGQQGISGTYTKTKEFSVANRYKTQLESVSRDKYFNTGMTPTRVSSKFTVKYQVSNSTYSIWVNADAPSSL